MQRRQFIALLGGTVATWPLAAVAQQSAIPTIGFLRSTRPDASTDLLVALRKGLKETGYVEGQNLTIEYRWAENRAGATVGPGGRSGSPTVRRNCSRRRKCRVRSKSRDRDNTDHFCDRRRPAQERPRGEFQPAGR